MQAALSNANTAVLRAQVTNRKVPESQVWRRKQGKSLWEIFLSSDSEERHQYTMCLSLEEHGWERRESTLQKKHKLPDFIFLGSKITADSECSHEIKRRLLLGRKVMTNLDSILKSQRHYLVNKGSSSQGYDFSSSHVWMWELDCEESWALKNWCFWSVVLEKTLESPLDCKEIKKKVHPKENQS